METSMATFVKVAEVASIAADTAMVVQVGGCNIALFNVAGTFYAIDDVCSHEGGSLGEGELAGEVVSCPWHCSQFSVKTGEGLGPPAAEHVRRFPVKIQGNDVLVEVD